MPDKEDTYPVGYGKPPVATRFQKGQSGNPKGRAHKVKESTINVESILNAAIQVKQGGRVRQISALEAALRRQVGLVINKNDKTALTGLLKIFAQHGVLRATVRRHPNVVNIPFDWDRTEWFAMYGKYGLPPWPGPRNGMSAMATASNTQETPAEKAERRNRLSAEARIVTDIAKEVMTIEEDGKQVKRSIVEILLIIVRRNALSGKAKDVERMRSLLSAYGLSMEMPRGALFIGDPPQGEEQNRVFFGRMERYQALLQAAVAKRAPFDVDKLVEQTKKDFPYPEKKKDEQ